MTRFEGRTFVITGGTGGIGLATAERLIGEGARVLVTGTSDERLERAGRLSPNLHVFKNDAADFAAADVLAAEARRLFGELDGVFLNAGVSVFARTGDITPELFRKQFDLNVGGVLFGAQALSPLVKDGGALLLMASAAKTKGLPGVALYAASKGAVRSITLVLARELATRGVRVNAISPGPTNTSFHSTESPEQEALLQVLKAAIPLGRMGRVEEVAAVAAFLLSSESSFVTGADYAVDGGEAQL